MMRWHPTRSRRRNKKNAILLPQKNNPKTKIKQTSRVESGDKKTGTPQDSPGEKKSSHN
jgi:hypothetical protein